MQAPTRPGRVHAIARLTHLGILIPAVVHTGEVVAPEMGPCVTDANARRGTLATSIPITHRRDTANAKKDTYSRTASKPFANMFANIITNSGALLVVQMITLDCVLRKGTQSNWSGKQARICVLCDAFCSNTALPRVKGVHQPRGSAVFSSKQTTTAAARDQRAGVQQAGTDGGGRSRGGQWCLPPSYSARLCVAVGRRSTGPPPSPPAVEDKERPGKPPRAAGESPSHTS